MSFVKNFVDWFKLKPKLDRSDYKSPFFKESEIWWCHIGENIGTEISGKSKSFTRPIIILKKLSKQSALAVPTSTKIKQGSWFTYFKHKNKEMVACLHQIRVVDCRRFQDYVGKIDSKDFEKVKESIKKLYNF